MPAVKAACNPKFLDNETIFRGGYSLRNSKSFSTVESVLPSSTQITSHASPVCPKASRSSRSNRSASCSSFNNGITTEIIPISFKFYAVCRAGEQEIPYPQAPFHIFRDQAARWSQAFAPRLL